LRHFAPKQVLGMLIWVSEMLLMMGRGCFSVMVISDAQFSHHRTANELYPGTIRAIFGHKWVRNAIHCTDFPKDGIIECKYFFKILCDLLVA
jgi:nucleoside diphosphate kinase